MRLLSIVGARPQFVKAAVVCRALASRSVTHEIVHTGQHYDDAMSDVFFRELEIPEPRHNLGVGSGTHACQTAEMMIRLEPVLAAERPDWVIVYGDTNSTLAASLVASKRSLRIAHIEAGLRSGVRDMPEEVNRIVADHLGEVLFCPTAAAIANLEREGLGARAVQSGDVMLDSVLRFREIAEKRGSPLLDQFRPGEFALATIHRAANTDDPERLLRIMRAIGESADSRCPVVLPLHPRTAKKLAELAWQPGGIVVLPPVSYLDMLLLEWRAAFIMTDSGGVQKEAYFARKPCITLRDETEWVETLANNCNVLTGSDPDAIRAAIRQVHAAGPWLDLYGDGSAGEKIASVLTN